MKWWKRRRYTVRQVDTEREQFAESFRDRVTKELRRQIDILSVVAHDSSQNTEQIAKLTARLDAKKIQIQELHREITDLKRVITELKQAITT